MLKIISFLCLIVCAVANFNGPFVLWGRPQLAAMKVAALESVADKLLRNLYSESAAIVLFLRNSTTLLSDDNFPNFKQLINKNEWTYLPQRWLSSDPIDYNVNAEVINLVGPVAQQDVELAALFNDAVNTYGQGKVLGILATKTDLHDLRKREATALDASSTIPSPTDEPPMQEDYVYADAAGKAILYTTSPPVLMYNNSKIELKRHGIVQSDDGNKTLNRLIITFIGSQVFKKEESKESKDKNLEEESTKKNVEEEPVKNIKITLRFRFSIENSYWYMRSVEVEEDTQRLELFVAGSVPAAPTTFSYKCSSSLVFRDNSTVLTLENIQVQILMNNKTRFSDAYDCVGFISAPIWSGIFVSSIMGVIIMMSIVCILEIKPPNRFESARGKQLTFTTIE